MTYDQHKAAFMKLVHEAARRHDTYRVFSDFVEMAAISIANAIHHSAEREKRYMQIVAAYEPNEVALFPKMLGHIQMALEAEYGDPLGEAYMALEVSNDRAGQFFTPYSVCQMIAGLNGNIAARVAEQGLVTVSDPAVGGGALLIAFAEEARRQGVNFQQHVHATGQDIDIKSVHMAYVQLSLIGLPAVVIHGDTLRMDRRSHWYTPMHVLGLWKWKLRRQGRIEPPAPALDLGSVPPQQPVARPVGQMELFA